MASPLNARALALPLLQKSVETQRLLAVEQHPETIILKETAMLDGVETSPRFPFGNLLGHFLRHSKVHVTGI